ncbi:MAG TPA: rRNA maturation RNase YbeY [Solirubrobacteraceae bacterium]|jgi:probable rRNA maturation factor|nr:rRNA maturation RNase YbeY [Solirubrobacteraceae bacterium]
MLDVEVFGATLAPGAPPPERLQLLCELAASSHGVHSGHVAIEFVSAERIAELNRGHRGKDRATDVLSFPIDGADGSASEPRELGDIVICAPRTADLEEAIVHGMLHLLGMDHERDRGEMLALQAELLGRSES